MKNMVKMLNIILQTWKMKNVILITLSTLADSAVHDSFDRSTTKLLIISC